MTDFCVRFMITTLTQILDPYEPSRLMTDMFRSNESWIDERNALLNRLNRSWIDDNYCCVRDAVCKMQYKSYFMVLEALGPHCRAS